MKKITIYWVLGIFTLSSFSVLCLPFTQRFFSDPEIISNQHLPLSAIVTTVNHTNINVRIADTVDTRTLGLSFFKELPDKQGMLFVFPTNDQYAFWMKDMFMNVDIIWINEDFTIIHRVINASPDTYPQTYEPISSSRYVLEIPANTADKYGLFLGEQVGIRK